MPAGAVNRVGQVLDKKYKLIRHIATGGMGAVYEAEHLLIGKRVAVKMLLPEFSKSKDVMGRFQREARAASAIGQQNIIDISDLGQAPDGSLFIVMELLRGQNLAERLAALGGRMHYGRAAHIVRQVLDALAATHRQAIIHRDLKPENIFLVERGDDPDFVKVLDFGISKVLSDDLSKLSTTGVVWGTPYYMAPEQARGVNVDHRLDLYACGAILYQLITGRLPFTAPNFNALMFEIAGGRYTPPKQIVPEIPAQLEQVIQYAMALDPNHRYQSAEQMTQSVAAFVPPPRLPRSTSGRSAVVPPPASEFDTRTPSALQAFAPPPPGLGAAPPVSRPNVMQVRRGSSKALPITISAGVAVGLCVGLLLVKGKSGNGTAPANTPTVSTPVAAPEPTPQPVVTPPAAVPDAAPPPAPIVLAPIDAGVAAPDSPVEATITVVVSPPEAAATAKIKIDEVVIEGTTAKFMADGKKKVRVEVTAKGYRSYDKRHVVTGDQTVDVVMKLRPAEGPKEGPGGSIKF